VAVSQEELANRFVYHAPKGDQVERYQFIRNAFHDLAVFITVNTPASREQSVALTELETAMMWANAAIARNEK
jgi:hypothetical protein